MSVRVHRLASVPGVAVVVIDSPKTVNAITRSMLLALAKAFRELRVDRSVKCVVLTATGRRAFSTGIDLRDAEGNTPLTIAAENGFESILGLLVDSSVGSVADINMAETIRYAQGYGPLMEEFPAIRQWLADAQGRPAFQKMWQARLAEPE